jgi:Concanavalin A-like lectin/glucanases superfamily
MIRLADTFTPARRLFHGHTPGIDFPLNNQGSAMKPSTFALPILFATALIQPAFAQVANDYVLQCNGKTDYVTSDILIAGANTFTMEAWVNPTMSHEIDPESSAGVAGCTGQRYAIYPLHGTALWGAGHAGAGFSVGTNGVTVYEHAGDYMPATLVYEGTIKGWTHVAVVYRDRVPSLFINGDLVRTGVAGTMKFVHPSAGMAAKGRLVYGGIGGGPWGYFEGQLDDIRLWKTARSNEEIRTGMHSKAAGADLRASFDMNRTGAGAGLDVVVANGTAWSDVIAIGTTVGTVTTPVFAPRDRGTSPDNPPSNARAGTIGDQPSLR